MRRIGLLLIAVLALVLFTTTVALAEDEAESKVVFCGQLAEADCTLLNDAQTALWDVSSGESAKTVDVYLDGFEQMPDHYPALTVIERSMFATDPATIDNMLALQEADLEELAQDPAALQAAMLLPWTIDSASSTTLVLSPELHAVLTERLGRDLPAELTFEIRLVDGIAYINVARFAELAPEASAFGDWIGIDLMAFMPRVAATRVAEGDYDLEELSESLTPPGKSMMAQPYLVMVEPGMEQVFQQFLEITPMRDSTIDGNDVAVYRMEMDVPAYVGSRAFLRRFPGLTDSVNGALPQVLRDAGMDIAGNLMHGLGATVLANTDALVLQGIGYQDAYLYAMEMHMGLAVAGRRVDVKIQTGNANIDDVAAVPAPDGAFVLPIRLIMGLIETFGGQ